jgi:N-carbamoyl-L-amino-acid hydrolase
MHDTNLRHRCVKSATRRAVDRSGLSWREIASTGHDAAYASHVAPTSMIFIPAAAASPHNEVEYSGGAARACLHRGHGK